MYYGKQSPLKVFSQAQESNQAAIASDNRLTAVIQNKAIDSVMNSARSMSQRKNFADALGPAAVKNNTGMPDKLKAGLEGLSGMDLSDVKVHYNSSEPRQLHALAFAKGNDIHLATGQQKHLAHEVWHVVQQKQGRVKPVRKMKGNVYLNDDPSLEKEADIMGAKAYANSGKHYRLSLHNASSTSESASGAAPVQRKIVKVPKGGASGSTWTFIRSDATHDYYDDGLPEPSVEALKPTRDAMNEIDLDELSDAEESDTELDAGTEGPHKVFRVNNLRDTAKLVHKVMRKDPTATIGARVGGTIFRLQGRDTQFFAQTTSQKALVQSDGSQGTGFMPARAKTDPKPTGNQASYEHVLTELNGHSATSVARAVYDKFVNKTPYPSTFSDRAQAKMNEMFLLLAIVEPYRSDYAWAIFTASIQAVINGSSLEDTFYKGKGQVEALHAGASSFKGSGVSGQLMEQNLGIGSNRPHPTNASMNISAEQWKSGADRTQTLFNLASSGTDYNTMLHTHLHTPMGFSVGARGIDNIVTQQRASPYGSAAVTVKIKHTAKLSPGDRVIYKKVNYTVRNVTNTGWVNLEH